LIFIKILDIKISKDMKKMVFDKSLDIIKHFQNKEIFEKKLV